MAEASIPVDLANPGQVFACLGFVETADMLLSTAQGSFDWSDSENTRFRLAAGGDENSVKCVLRFLDRASVRSIAPEESSNATERWGIETATDGAGAFPYRDPSSPATLPARLEDGTGYRVARHRRRLGVEEALKADLLAELRRIGWPGRAGGAERTALRTRRTGASFVRRRAARSSRHWQRCAQGWRPVRGPPVKGRRGLETGIEARRAVHREVPPERHAAPTYTFPH